MSTWLLMNKLHQLRADHLCYNINLRTPTNAAIQIFMLSGSSGFIYDFEISSRARGPVESDPNLSKINTSSDDVVRFFRTMPEGLIYKLFFAN